MKRPLVPKQDTPAYIKQLVLRMKTTAERTLSPQHITEQDRRELKQENYPLSNTSVARMVRYLVARKETTR